MARSWLARAPQAAASAPSAAGAAKWGVLSDDYLIGARMKDWGRPTQEQEQELDADVGSLDADLDGGDEDDNL